MSSFPPKIKPPVHFGWMIGTIVVFILIQIGVGGIIQATDPQTDDYHRNRTLWLGTSGITTVTYQGVITIAVIFAIYYVIHFLKQITNQVHVYGKVGFAHFVHQSDVIKNNVTTGANMATRFSEYVGKLQETLGKTLVPIVTQAARQQVKNYMP